MAGQHSSNMWRGIKVLVKYLIGPIVAGVCIVLLFQRFWGAETAIDNARALEADAQSRDNSMPAAEVSFVGYGDASAVNPWPGWVSSGVVDIPPGVKELPLPAGATNIGRPTLDVTDPENPEFLSHVSKEIVFNLKGLTSTAAMVTSIEVIIARQGAAPAGTVLWVMPQGDGLRGEIGFDLSPGASAAARVINEYGGLGEMYFNQRTVTLDRDEYLGYQALIFAPPNTDTEFFIRTNFDNGTHVDLRDAAGKNFRITSYPLSAQRAFVNSSPTGSYDEMGLYECVYPAGCAYSYNAKLQAAPTR